VALALWRMVQSVSARFEERDQLPVCSQDPLAKYTRSCRAIFAIPSKLSQTVAPYRDYADRDSFHRKGREFQIPHTFEILLGMSCGWLLPLLKIIHGLGRRNPSFSNYV